MAAKYDYNVLILGAGPGGYVAAIRAAQLGLKVGVIEKDKPGGVCLNIGCIPSKSLLHQASLYRSIGKLEEMGLKVEREGFQYHKVYEKSRNAADTLSKGVQYLLRKNKIDLIPGEGKINDPHRVILTDGKEYTGDHIIIATGSRPRQIPGFPFDEKTILSSTGALMLQALPKRILILGGGAIGIEFAHMMNSFGTKVHVVEMMNRILPLEDEDTVSILEKSLRKTGIAISTASKALFMKKTKEEIAVTLEGKDGIQRELPVDKVLVAVGRIPNTDAIGLDNVGIKTEKGYIPVGDYYQTRIDSIYAIGDVINSPLLAHVASKEGEIAASHIGGQPCESRVSADCIPSAVYCEPQIGSFGYTEQRAKKEGIPFDTAIFPYRGAGKSVAIEEPEGLVKILYDPTTKELLGGHIVGSQASELIHELLLAKSAELLPEDIAEMIHAHPTLSESIMEVMRAADGWAIHI